MEYPTEEEVNKATRLQMGTWVRNLPSPGMNAFDAGADVATLEKTVVDELKILELIILLFNKVGGWSPVISKIVGYRKL